MTRALHGDTRVQRGDPESFSQAALARGYEAEDAPPDKVALGVAAFVALMFVGLGAAGLVADMAKRAPSAAAATRGAHPLSAPRLLANPAQQRRQIEGAAKHRLGTGPMPIDRAMDEVARAGWGEEGPPSGPAAAAREHVEAAR